MKTLFRWLFRLLVLLVVLAVAFVLLLDTMAKALAEREIARQTGLPVTIGRMEVGLLNPKFRVENLVLYNAPPFGGAPMISLPEVLVEYRWRELMHNKLHITRLRFNLAEIHVIEGPDGRTNLRALDERIGLLAQNQPAANRTARSPEPEFAGIDTLVLTFRRIKYSSLRTNTVGDFDLFIDNYTITSIRQQEDIFAALRPLMIQKGAELIWQMLTGERLR